MLVGEPKLMLKRLLAAAAVLFSGSTLWAATLSPLDPQTWGTQRRLPWHKPLIFRQLLLSATAQSSNLSVIGALNLRYQVLGYQIPRPALESLFRGQALSGAAMFWVPRLIPFALFWLLLWAFCANHAHAQFGCVPNPNLGPWSGTPNFVNGCPLPPSALNLLAPATNPVITGTNPLGNALTVNGVYTGTSNQAFQQGTQLNLTDTGTNQTGVAKINGLTSNLTFGGGATGPGNRTAVWGTVKQIGDAGYDGAAIFQSGLVGWSDIQSTTSNSAHALDYNGVTAIAQLEGASLAAHVVGVEADVDIGGTSAVVSRIGALVQIGGSYTAANTRGSAFDAGLAFGIDASATAGATWKNGIVFGNGTWPFTTDSKLVAAFGAAGAADTGIDFSNVTFSTNAIFTPGFKVNPSGKMSGLSAELGSFGATVAQGELGIARVAASGSAPGAAYAKIAVVCGTNAGTAKLIAYAGTSSTPVTILDNIGSGVSGC